MKHLITNIVFLLFCFSISTYSQWGVKGGYNSSSITNSNAAKPLSTFHIGCLYDLKLSEKWYLQPEFQIVGIGCSLSDDKLVLRDGHVRIYALEVPVNFSFRPMIRRNEKLLFDLGLYTRYGLFGNKTYEYYQFEKIDQSPFDAYNRFDAGLNLGIGLQKEQYFGFITFQQGLFQAEKDIDGYHQVFKFSVGYRF